MINKNVIIAVFSMQRGLNLLEPPAFAEVSITKIEWDNRNYFSTLTPGVHHWLQLG